LYERVVTVTGAILANPGNFLVRIGTSLRELIEAAGPLREEPHKVIAGGPMMGVAQFSLDAPVVKGTSGVLLLGADEKRIVQTSCIRCGACIRSCPVGLMPCMINLVVEKNMTEQTKAYGALDCIECGLCSFHCPARIPLVQSIRLGKRILAQP
jgi:electron transport complex protein RnfC